MCHTWGLARLPADLQGGQRGGHHEGPLHVVHYGDFWRFCEGNDNDTSKWNI